MPFEMHPVRRRRISVAAVSTLLFTLPGCAILNPPDRTELTQQALAETALPAVWKFAKTPGEFDVETLGFELPEELATLIREGQAAYALTSIVVTLICGWLPPVSSNHE